MKKKISGLLMVIGLLIALTVPALAGNGGFHTSTSIPVAIDGGGVVVIEPVDDAPEPDTLKLTLDSKKVGEFKFEYDEPDTFQYKIYQVAGTNKNVKYDDSVYTATIMIEASDEGLGTIVALEKDGEKEDEALFKNETIVKKASNQVKATKTGDSQWPFACAALCSVAVILFGTARKKKEEN